MIPSNHEQHSEGGDEFHDHVQVYDPFHSCRQGLTGGWGKTEGGEQSEGYPPSDPQLEASGLRPHSISSYGGFLYVRSSGHMSGR